MVPVNIRARIDRASHGQIQPPLKASSAIATTAASAAPTIRDMPRSTTAKASPASTARSATSAMSLGVATLLVKKACGSRPPMATAAAAKPSAYQLLRLCTRAMNKAVSSR